MITKSSAGPTKELLSGRQTVNGQQEVTVRFPSSFSGIPDLVATAHLKEGQEKFSGVAIHKLTKDMAMLHIDNANGVEDIHWIAVGPMG